MARDVRKVIVTSLPSGLATDASVDGLEAMLQQVITELGALLEEGVFTARVGEVQATPTANTLLARLKTLHDDLVTLTGSVDGLEGFASQQITELGALLEESVFTGRVGEVQATPTSNTMLGRLKAITDAVDGAEGLLQQIVTTLGNPAQTADVQAVRDRLPSSLRNSRLDAADTYTAGEVLPDQSGADAVLTFTFANPMDLIWVESTGADSRADPFGGTPTVSLGIPCRDGIPKPLVIRATVVKVYAPTGASVNVFGQRYS